MRGMSGKDIPLFLAVFLWIYVKNGKIKGRMRSRGCFVLFKMFVLFKCFKITLW